MNPFESGRTRALWVLAIFGILAIVNIVGVFSSYSEAELIQDIIDNKYVSDSDIESNDDRQALIGMVQMALYIAVAIAFLMWIHRAHRNLQSLGNQDLKYSPGWAVGWFFIPIMNLFRPYQVMSEIWRGSDPDLPIGDSRAWKSSTVSSLVGWWWAFYLICEVVAQITSRVAFQGEELSEMKSAAYLFMASDSIDIVGFLVTSMLVWQIVQRQEQKHMLVGDLPISKKPWFGEEAPPTGEFTCPSCNRYVYKENKFCPFCGEPLLEVVGYSCSGCGKDVESDWKVCPNCGESL